MKLMRTALAAASLSAVIAIPATTDVEAAPPSPTITCTTTGPSISTRTTAVVGVRELGYEPYLGYTRTETSYVATSSVRANRRSPDISFSGVDPVSVFVGANDGILQLGNSLSAQAYNSYLNAFSIIQAQTQTFSVADIVDGGIRFTADVPVRNTRGVSFSVVQAEVSCTAR